MTAERSEALLEVDRLVARGELALAAQLLEEALVPGEGTPQLWLQLAGLKRALKQPRRSLDAVLHALQLAPLDFMALVMRAGLLERLGDQTAGPAWEEALAQRPPGDLAPPLAAAVLAGEACLAAWRKQRAAHLNEASAALEAKADPDAAWRIGRFRSNVLRETQVFHSQPTHFQYPGLTEREFHPRANFPWLEQLESATQAITAEMQAVIASSRSELVPYVQYPDHEPLAQWRKLNRNPDWTAVHLIKQGEVQTANAAQCPQTMAMLAQVPQPQVPGASPNAMFSLLAPQTVIPPHVGIDNSRLVCHLPLVVPEGCWFRVGAETRFWQEGQAFVFDDTIEHEAANPSDRLRVVLIFDVWHPGLDPLERDAVAAIIAADGAGTAGL
jgi:aspartyl/asparaginyl beta-hydroxylase (cupin superfamily)